MIFLIELIEKYKKPFVYSSIVFFLCSVCLIIFSDSNSVPRILLIIFTTVLFSLININAGYAVAVFSMTPLVLSAYIHDTLVLPMTMRQALFMGLITNIFIAHIIGSLKAAFLSSKALLIQVEKSKLQYQKVVDTIKEGMIILDDAGKVTFLNKAANDILGIPFTKEVGFDATDLVDSDEIIILLKEKERRKKGITSEYEINYNHPERGKRRIFIAATPYLNKERQNIGSLGFIQDITDVKAQYEINEVLLKRNAFIFSEIDHSIANTLTLIRAYFNIYISDKNISKQEGLKKVDHIIKIMCILNRDYFYNFDRQTVSMKMCVEKIALALAGEVPISHLSLTLELQNKEQHISTALPFALLLTILLSNIYSRIVEEGSSTKMLISMENEYENIILLISVNYQDFFKERHPFHSFPAEEEIVNALLSQIGGSLSLHEGKTNKLKIVA
jgi:PAS domain S-box-containing protein